MKRLTIIPAPGKVLVQITHAQIENITSRWITRLDGKKVKLFVEPSFDPGFDRRFMQNVSVGKIIGIGEDVRKVYVGDIAIIDYLVTNSTDVLIGYFKGNQIVCIDAESTYHTDDSMPSQTGRMAWVKGDHDVISPLIGVIRENQVIAFDPYIFLVSKSNKIVRVLPNGKMVETKEFVSSRSILSAPANSGLKDGDEIMVKEENMFPRYINEKEISVIFKEDILVKKDVPNWYK